MNVCIMPLSTMNQNDQMKMCLFVGFDIWSTCILFLGLDFVKKNINFISDQSLITNIELGTWTQMFQLVRHASAQCMETFLVL